MMRLLAVVTGVLLGAAPATSATVARHHRGVVVGAAGDIACGAASGSAQCRQMLTSDMLLRMRPDAVLALGDTQYETGAYSDFLRFYDPSWGRLKAITHPTVGNHEYGTPGAAGYFDYFDGPGNATGPAGRRGKGWYAFDLGAWRLYALNTSCGQAGGCSRGSPQYRWFRRDLARHRRACTLMFLHNPLVTSDTREFDTPAERATWRPLWRAFHAHGGDVALTGHSHFYERFAPIDPDGRIDREHGIREFIVGTGGRNVYDPGPPEQASRARIGHTFGVLRLRLRAAGYRWRFLAAPGAASRDVGGGRCH